MDVLLLQRRTSPGVHGRWRHRRPPTLCACNLATGESAASNQMDIRLRTDIALAWWNFQLSRRFAILLHHHLVVASALYPPKHSAHHAQHGPFFLTLRWRAALSSLVGQNKRRRRMACSINGMWLVGSKLYTYMVPGKISDLVHLSTGGRRAARSPGHLHRAVASRAGSAKAAVTGVRHDHLPLGRHASCQALCCTLARWCG